jgi:heme exporter protein D
MQEFLSMGGNGPYVWSAYGITLGVLIWNIWSARARLRRKLHEAATDPGREEPSRRPRVSHL